MNGSVLKEIGELREAIAFHLLHFSLGTKMYNLEPSCSGQKRFPVAEWQSVAVKDQA
jgi:hypothetical protein